jgi:hypothetical protein
VNFSESSGSREKIASSLASWYGIQLNVPTLLRAYPQRLLDKRPFTKKIMRTRHRRHSFLLWTETIFLGILWIILVAACASFKYMSDLRLIGTVQLCTAMIWHSAHTSACARALWPRSSRQEKEARMMGAMKHLMSLLISGALIAGSGGAAMAQQSDKDKDSVKQTTKDVANDTKKAGKATGKAVKKTTKKVVHKAASETKKGAEKVEDKTNPKK